MKVVGKYNLLKAVSTLLCVGTPIASICFQCDLFIHRSDTAMSMAGVIAIVLAAFACKDKLAKEFKVPHWGIIGYALFALGILLQKIIEPVMIAGLITGIVGTIDMFTFDIWLKSIEAKLPEQTKSFMKFGFICTTTERLEKVNETRI